MMSENTNEQLMARAEERFAILDDVDGSEELLSEYDHHAFQFVTADDEGFVVDIRDGEVSVQPTAQWDEDFLSRPPTVIQADRAVLRDILNGDETIVDGVWGGSVQAPVYGAQMGYTSWISRLLKAIRNGRVD